MGLSGTRAESSWKRKTWIDDSTLSRASIKLSYHFPRLSLPHFFLCLPFFTSKVAPSRGFLLLFRGSQWFFKLPGLFLFFLRLLLLLFFFVFYPSSVVDPLFNFSFLVPPSVTFGHGDGIEILRRVLFLRRFLFYLTFYEGDGC